MPQDLPVANQSQSNNQENEKPQSPPEKTSRPSSNTKGVGSINVDDKDLDMQDHDADHSLQRFGNSITEDVSEEDDDEDDSEEDQEHMANHPLLNMLSGRLGQRRRGSAHKWDKLHPVTQVLSIANVDDCTKLEEEAFPENERCSREKFEYRLARCPELSFGIFTGPTKVETESLESPPSRRLIAHIVSTRTPAPCVTDASMSLPPNWRSTTSSLPRVGDEEPSGHQEVGGTVCVHSLAVAKEHQAIGLGTILTKAYIQRIKDSKSADRIALLAHDHLIDFYSSFGFQNMGPSAATFGGGGWNNMILEFGGEDEED